MNTLFLEFKEIQEHETPVLFSWNKALNYLNFPIDSPWRKFGEMFIVSQPDLNYSPNAYHNQIHSAEAIFSAAILIKEEFEQQEQILYAPYLLFGMMCHDISHNGSHNTFPYELENLAVNAMKKQLNTKDIQSYWNTYLQSDFGSLHRFQRRIKRLILGTDFKIGIEKNIQAYEKYINTNGKDNYNKINKDNNNYMQDNQHRIKNNPFISINTLANEADIFVSIMNDFGKEKGLLLSVEQNQPQIATKEGQLFFLEHLARYVSYSSKKLGIPDYINKQIKMIKVI